MIKKFGPNMIRKKEHVSHTRSRHKKTVKSGATMPAAQVWVLIRS